MKFCVLALLFLTQTASGNQVKATRNFGVVAYRLGYSDKLHSTILEMCVQQKQKSATKNAPDDPGDCRKKAAAVFQVIRKKMEAAFYESFPSKSEQEYFAALFSHPLMGKLYDFRTEFVEDPKTRQQILDELKK